MIRNKSGIIELLCLINGKFRTPKKVSLHKLIDWINNHPKYINLITNNLIKLSLDNSFLNSNA
jgi:hypothetical protein